MKSLVLLLGLFAISAEAKLVCVNGSLNEYKTPVHRLEVERDADGIISVNYSFTPFKGKTQTVSYPGFTCKEESEDLLELYGCLSASPDATLRSSTPSFHGSPFAVFTLWPKENLNFIRLQFKRRDCRTEN